MLKKEVRDDSKDCHSPPCNQSKLLQQKHLISEPPHDYRGYRVKDLKKMRHKDIEQKDILMNDKQEKRSNELRHKGPDVDVGADNAGVANIDFSQIPRGVHIQQASYYVQTIEFTCLHSKVRCVRTVPLFSLKYFFIPDNNV